MAALNAAIRFPNYEAQRRRSKANYEFDLTETQWRIDRSTTINWALMPDIDPTVYSSLVLTTARMAEECSAAHAYNCWRFTRMYFFQTKHYTGGLITKNQLLNLRASLSKDNEYKLGTIRSYLRNWLDWEYPGLEPDLAAVLDRLTLAGNNKGGAVLHNCAHSGPYTIMEQQSILVWAGSSFAAGDLTLEEFTWFYLAFVTARRPVQLSALRCGDISHLTEGGKRSFRINIPRAKQRGYGFRELMRDMTITQDVYLVLMNLVTQVQTEVLDRFSGLELADLNALPLFISRRRLLEFESVGDLRTVLVDRPDYLHATSSGVGQLTRSISRKCDAISERTADFIHFTVMRCRRTRATNLVRDGISGTQLAYLLDHSDIRQLKVYTGYTPEFAVRIFEKMGDAMNLLSTMFEGRLIASEGDAIRGKDPTSRVRKSGGVQVGNCGGSPACHSGIKACLLCRNFQPMLDAPWDELLVELLEEVESQRELGASDMVIQSYDLQLAHTRAIMNACDRILRADKECS